MDYLLLLVRINLSIMKHILTLAALLILHTLGYSATITSNATGQWDVGATWVGGVAPGASDDVVIASGHTVYINGSDANCQSLLIDGSSGQAQMFFFSANDLTIANDMTITGTNATNKGTFNASSLIDVSIGGDLIFNGSIAAAATFTHTGGSGSEVIIGGTVIYSSAGTYSCSNGVLTKFNGTGAQSIPGDSENASYYALEIDKSSGTATLSSNITAGSLNQNFILTNGTLDDGGYSIAAASGTFSMAASTVWNSTATIFPAFSTYSLNSSSTINYTGSGSDYKLGSGSKTISFGTVNVNGGGEINAVGTVNLDGTMTLSGTSIFDVNGATVAGSGSLILSTNDSLTISSGSYPTTSTITNPNGYVIYSGTNQNIDAKDFEKLILAGSGTKTLSGAGSVSTSLLIRNGVIFNSNSQVFTIKSSATGTAGVKCTGSGTTSGDFTVERYVSDMTASGNPGWWWMLGAPVNGQTIASIEDDILTTGVAGGDFPTQSFKSIQAWDVAGQYYDSALTQSTAMTAGKGFFVYMGSTSATYDVPYTIDYVGEINTGDFAFTSELSGIGATDEWAILANPYPSSVEFNLIAMPFTDIKNPYIITKAGGFAALSNNTILASGEAFWVESNSASPSLTFRESDKPGTLEANSLFNKSTKSSGSAAAPDRLRIETTSMYAYEDFCYLELDDNKTFGMDYPSDFDKLENIYSYTNVSMDVNGQLAHINTIPSNFTGVKSFPIHFSRLTTFSQTVGMTLKIKGVEDFKKRGICLSIEDLATGTITTLDTNYTVTTNWYDTVTAAQFILHLASVFEESTTDATCYGLSDGSVTAALSVSGTYDYFLKDVGGTIINQELGKSGISHTFNSLNAGMYSVEVNDNGSCGVISQNVSVDEPDAVLSSFSPNSTTVDISFDPEVQFTNNSANAGNYFWNFDDGNTSSLDNPKHTFTLEKIHNVALVAEGGPCADTSYKTITVVNTHVGINELNNDKVKFYRSASSLQIKFNLNAADNVIITIFDVKGKQVEKSNAYSVKSNRISIQLPEAAGMYVIKINGSGINTSKQVIVTN